MTTNQVGAVAQALHSFADSLEPQEMAQAESCETALLGKLSGLGQKVALQAADEITVYIRDYLACRFGMPPQSAEAQGLLDQIGAIIKDCAVGNLRLFLFGGWQAYAAAVAKCAAGKLLGGGLGGIIGGSPSDFNPAPTHRCGS
jgi:hypothetical protein